MWWLQLGAVRWYATCSFFLPLRDVIPDAMLQHMADAFTQGYQQLSEATPVVYGPRRAYDVEKPPSVPIPTSEPYGSMNLPLGQQSAFSPSDQASLTSPPLTGYPLLPNQPPLVTPMTYGDNPNHHHGLPLSDYYVPQPFKQDPGLLNPSVISDYALQQDPSSLPYGTDLSFNVPPLPTSEDMAHYSLVPNWNEASLVDHQDNFGNFLSNQRGGKRGPFKDPNLREQTALTRKIGSCIRCRMQRIRVSASPSRHWCQSRATVT